MADAVSEFFYSCSGKQTDGKDENRSVNTKSSKKNRHADSIKVNKQYADDIRDDPVADDRSDN